MNPLVPIIAALESWVGILLLAVAAAVGLLTVLRRRRSDPAGGLGPGGPGSTPGIGPGHPRDPGSARVPSDATLAGTPRDAILGDYRRFLGAVERRRPIDLDPFTPTEVSRWAASAWPGEEPRLAEIGRRFERARYCPEDVSVADAARFRELARGFWASASVARSAS